MIWLSVISAAMASPPTLLRPVQSTPSPLECPASIPLRAGDVAPLELVGLDRVVICSAVAEPTTSLAHLLAVSEYSVGLENVYRLDTDLLKADRDHYRGLSESRSPWLDAAGFGGYAVLKGGG
jgi:hypothetical protein